MCIEAFEVGVQGIHLLALALQVGAGLVDLRAGNMAVCRQGCDPFLGYETWLAQLLGTAQVHPRTVERGLVGSHLSLPGGDQTTLLGQATLCLCVFRFTGGQGGAGAVNC
ncbi:hypothetical protein D3C80_1656880 [compost metagenome]